MDIPDVPTSLDRRKLVWSFSSLNCYLSVCPYQFYARYVSKAYPFKGSDASRYGDEVHAALEARVGKRTPLPPAHASFEPFAAPFAGREPQVERKLAVTAEGKSCDFWHNDAWFRGKIDLFVVRDDTAYVCDWKTGRVWEKPFELECFALLLKATYPQLEKIVGQFVWLKEGRLGKLYDLSDVESTWRTLKTAVAEIEADGRWGVWEKREGPLCGWCPVQECEHNAAGAQP